MVREYFLGGNTVLGFFSYYDFLAETESFNKIYIIKGGPGTGKSSLMKAVTKWGTEKGFDVDRIRCSSDPDSLDGVVIPDIGIAFVDGTAPHVVDPKYPGAAETIINMGDFWDENAVKENKNEIVECGKAISKKYSEAYNYLGAAGNLHKNFIADISEKDAFSTVSEILGNLHFAARTGKGKERKLFAEAITPDGIISCADTFEYGNRIILKSDNPANLSVVFDKLLSKLCEMGYDSEVFYSPMNPECEIRHIVIPEENTCILTSDAISLVSEKDAKIIEIEGDGVDCEIMKCTLLEMTLLNRAVNRISAAKKLHDKLESFYSPNIDFDAMGKMREEIFGQLEMFAQTLGKGNRLIEEI